MRPASVATAFAVVALAGVVATHAYVLAFEANVSIAALREWEDPAQVHAALGDAIRLHGQVLRVETATLDGETVHILVVSDGSASIDVGVTAETAAAYGKGAWVRVAFLWQDDSGLYGDPVVSGAVPRALIPAGYSAAVVGFVAAAVLRRDAARAA